MFVEIYIGNEKQAEICINRSISKIEKSLCMKFFDLK